MAQRPSLYDLGLNRLACGCLIAQAAVLALVVVVYRAHGLSIVFDPEKALEVALPGLCFVIWVSFLISPGPRRAWITAEAALAFLLMHAITWTVAPGQYGALAIGRPFVDGTLAQADAVLGINVSDVLAWVQQHPRVLTVLRWAYGTLSLQILFAIPVLRFLREREAMWEFVFHFHFCLIVTLVASALWPVAGPYQWFAYTTPVDLGRVVAQVNGFHDGTLTVVRWAELEGLISYPSFHTATGLFATWAVRKRWWLVVPLAMVNGLLILATFMMGIHYVIDTISGGLVFAMSLLMYQVAKGRRVGDTQVHV